MKTNILILISCLIFLVSCNNNQEDNLSGPSASENFNNEQFEKLLNEVAEGWNTGNARKAANCFTESAVYIEPPDRQLYLGREKLFEFFGGDEGRADPMKMTWHHLIYDKKKQIGTGEYTFAYKGRKTHGIVIVQILNGKINRWREYQYRTEIEWTEFIGKSAF